MRHTRNAAFVLTIASALAASRAYAQSVPSVGTPVCVANCNLRQPSGPSPYELEQNEEEQRTQNEIHMQEANDQGVYYFKKGDWALAIRSFNEGLQYSPNDPDILHNLSRAKEAQAKAQRNYNVDMSGHDAVHAPLDPTPHPLVTVSPRPTETETRMAPTFPIETPVRVPEGTPEWQDQTHVPEERE
jgi:hypothetical protein